jgi:hypothetical protein
MELRAAGAEKRSAAGVGAGMDWNGDIAAFFAVLDREAIEIRVAVAASGGSEFRFHAFNIAC